LVLNFPGGLFRPSNSAGPLFVENRFHDDSVKKLENQTVISFSHRRFFEYFLFKELSSATKAGDDYSFEDIAHLIIFVKLIFLLLLVFLQKKYHESNILSPHFAEAGKCRTDENETEIKKALQNFSVKGLNQSTFD
jgi:hypothetical protein